MFHYFNRQSEHLFRHNDSALQFSIICHFVSIYLLWLLKWPKPNRSRSHNENSYTRMWIECLHWHWDNERNFTSSLCTFQQSVFWLVAEISLADKRAHHSKASKSIDFAICIKRCVCAVWIQLRFTLLCEMWKWDIIYLQHDFSSGSIRFCLSLKLNCTNKIHKPASILFGLTHLVCVWIVLLQIFYVHF